MVQLQTGHGFKQNACRNKITRTYFAFFSVPAETSDVAAAETTEADKPPADCEDEKNPYDTDRWDELKIFTLIQF